MKKIYTLFFLCLICSIVFIGCAPDNSLNQNGGFINEDGEIVGDDGKDHVTEDGNSLENDKDNGTEGENTQDNPEKPENNTDVDSGDNSQGTDNIEVGKEESGGSENGSNNPEESGGGEVIEQPDPPKVGTAVGDLMASVTLEKLDGSSISTDELRGKILILNIWATWCPPCKAELPDFNRIATEYKDDVVIIAAHTPNGSINAESYVQQNFPETDIIFAYDTPYSEAYNAAGGVGYVPQTAILDENGVIIYSNYGILTYNQLVSIIEGQLSK